jgi:putative transposase
MADLRHSRRALHGQRFGFHIPTHGICSRRLEMQFVFSTPGHPRGRGRIERFFRSVNEMFLCTLDGYMGKVRKKPSLSLEAFDALFKSFLIHTYHSMPRAEDELSPVQRWEKGGFLPRMPDSLERLDLLLVHEAKERKVRPDGVQFLRLRYLSPVLAASVGESVTVRYDPRDLGEIRVFYKDKFLCGAISAELAGATVPLREIVRSRKERKSELQGILKSRQRAVDSLLDLKRGHVPREADVNLTVPVQPAAPKLKRYRNE